MSIWAIADLHLAFGVPTKTMDVFGNKWIGYADKIKRHWEAVVQPDDLVLMAGDISWAMKLEQAKIDFEWINALPGTKIMIRGNHDYWWGSLAKVQQALPSSIQAIQNSAVVWNDVVVGGARLWDSPEYTFNHLINFTPRPNSEIKRELNAEDEKIFKRELGRLELSLQAMDKHVGTKIVMTHYPPVSDDLKDSHVSVLLEKYQIDVCVFGHLHNVKEGLTLFGEKKGVRYYLTSSDFLDFAPLKII